MNRNAFKHKLVNVYEESVDKDDSHNRAEDSDQAAGDDEDGMDLELLDEDAESSTNPNERSDEGFISSFHADIKEYPRVCAHPECELTLGGGLQTSGTLPTELKGKSLGRYVGKEVHELDTWDADRETKLAKYTVCAFPPQSIGKNPLLVSDGGAEVAPKIARVFLY